MRRHFDNFIAGAINWLWRKRSTGLTLIRISIPVWLALLGAGWGMKVFVPTSSGLLRFSLDMNQGPPAYLIVVGLLMAVLMSLAGFILLFVEQRRLGKRRAVGIELRGLRDTTGDPLKDKIPRTISGRREQILISIRWSDGRILEPEDALKQIIHLPMSISRKRQTISPLASF